MEKTKIKGKIVKLFPTKELIRKDGTSTGSSLREFWLEEINDDKPDALYHPILAFEIYSKPGAERNYTEILDTIPVESVVKFEYIPIASKPWTNARGEERIFTTLRVAGKIDVLNKGKETSSAPAPAEPGDDFAEDDSMEMPF